MLVPALVTLGVTVLRLVGELCGWSPLFFSRAPGSASLVGIAWLAPVFGAYFGANLASRGPAPRAGRVIGFAALAAVPVPLAALVSFPGGYVFHELAVAAASIAGAWTAFLGWPALGRVLLAYALAARVPVIVVSLAATLGGWGTHYDTVPPAMIPALGRIGRWILAALLPQLTFWVAFTMIAGAGAAGLAVAVMPRRRTAPPARAEAASRHS